VTGEFDPRYDRRYQPGYVPGPDESAVSEPDLREPNLSGLDLPELDLPEQDLPKPDLPEPNPFERTLLGAGAVLLVGGVATAFWASSINYYPSTLGSPWTWQQLLQSAAWALSAPMATAGLAIGVGVLFRRAITWRPPE
jgi:hypothetical protein